MSAHEPADAVERIRSLDAPPPGDRREAWGDGRPRQPPSAVRNIAQIDSAALILDALPEALILLQPGLAVARLNRAARELFQTCPTFSINRDRLEAPDPGDLAPLKGFVEQAPYRQGTSRDYASFVAGHGDHRLLVNARFVTASRTISPAYGAAVLLSLRRDRSSSDLAKRLQRESGLTRAEARIALQMLSGYSLREIAQTSGVSYATVRCQLQSVFSKTDTKGQRQLLLFLARLRNGDI